MKQLLKKMGAILLIAFSVSSCTRAFITFYNKKDPMKKKSVWVKEEREIIHIPMIHIARQEYYDKVKQFITEKRQQGYAIYYEGVETGGETKQEQDTIMMKVRKILCINISGGYDDKKYRDEYLFDFIKKSTDKKIILLYGEAHKWNLYPLLRKDGFILKEGNRSTTRIYGGDTNKSAKLIAL